MPADDWSPAEVVLSGQPLRPDSGRHLAGGRTQEARITGSHWPAGRSWRAARRCANSRVRGGTTEVHTHGQDWWTLGFEATGLASLLHSALRPPPRSCSPRPCPVVWNPASMTPGPMRSGWASGRTPKATPAPKTVPVPSRLARRSARHARLSPTGNTRGGITAARHIEAVRLALRAHGRSQGQSVSWPGWPRTEAGESNRPRTRVAGGRFASSPTRHRRLNTAGGPSLRWAARREQGESLPGDVRATATAAGSSNWLAIQGCLSGEGPVRGGRPGLDAWVGRKIQNEKGRRRYRDRASGRCRSRTCNLHGSFVASVVIVLACCGSGERGQ